MSQSPQPSWSARRVPNVTGQGARSFSPLVLGVSFCAKLSLLSDIPKVRDWCSSQVSGGQRRGEGLVAWAMTVIRDCRCFVGIVAVPLQPQRLDSLPAAIHCKFKSCLSTVELPTRCPFEASCIPLAVLCRFDNVFPGS